MHNLALNQLSQQNEILWSSEARKLYYWFCPHRRRFWKHLLSVDTCPLSTFFTRALLSVQWNVISGDFLDDVFGVDLRVVGKHISQNLISLLRLLIRNSKSKNCEPNQKREKKKVFSFWYVSMSLIGELQIFQQVLLGLQNSFHFLIFSTLDFNKELYPE